MPKYHSRTAAFAAFVVISMSVLDPILVQAGDAIGFESFKVGGTISVKGEALGARQITAAKIKIRSPYKLEGPLQGIDAAKNRLTVIGLRMSVVDDAEIEDPDGTPIEISALRIGQMVKVKGNVHPDGRLEAAKISLLRSEYTLEGPIQAIDLEANGLTVLGIQNLTGFETEIEDAEGIPIEVSSLRRGQVVKIKGNVRADGLFVASRIKPGKPGKGAKVEGVVEKIDPAKRTLTVLGVGIRVNPQTMIEYR